MRHHLRFIANNYIYTKDFFCQIEISLLKHVKIVEISGLLVNFVQNTRFFSLNFIIPSFTTIPGLMPPPPLCRK